MIWNFINGWLRARYKQAKTVLLMLLLVIDSGYVTADEQQSDSDNNSPSIELLEMLGQFEEQDQNWLENEINNEMSMESQRQASENVSE